ncbi:MAG TPA: DUF3558 domain-containing protein [Actinophytocola sp.]|jgi:hypothetical protein|nr:DUF3558 domain-containing protein [Actinophytocola sp.]
MSTVVRWLAAGGLALVLAACSTTEAGSPRAADPAVTSEGDGPSLNQIEPCDLLSGEDLSRLGLGDGEEADFGDSPGCDWSKSADFGVLIGLSPDLGAEEANLQGATPVPVTVGSHDAFRVEEQGGAMGSCAILVVVSDSSYVDVTTTAGDDTPKACDKANEVAELVEPKLP